MTTPKFYELQLTVSPQAANSIVSSANPNPYSDHFLALMTLLGGQTVTAHAYSSTNLCGYTSTEQLQECFEQMDTDTIQYGRVAPHMDTLIEKFGDGSLGFDMSRSLCDEFPKDIEAMIESEKSIEAIKNTKGFYQKGLAIIGFVTHKLLVQNKQSCSIFVGHMGNGCAYRGDNGSKCAIGHLIADQNYDIDIEGLDLDSDIVWDCIQKSIGKIRSKNLEDLLWNLQTTHDESKPAEWPTKLDAIKNEWIDYQGKIHLNKS
jgi:hypothetical protein